jgi:hypothetical protein
MNIKEVYEKYKHMDKVFSDRTFVDTVKDEALYELWQAVKKESCKNE